MRRPPVSPAGRFLAWPAQPRNPGPIHTGPANGACDHCAAPIAPVHAYCVKGRGRAPGKCASTLTHGLASLLIPAIHSTNVSLTGTPVIRGIRGRLPPNLLGAGFFCSQAADRRPQSARLRPGPYGPRTLCASHPSWALHQVAPIDSDQVAPMTVCPIRRYGTPGSRSRQSVSSR